MGLPRRLKKFSGVVRQTALPGEIGRGERFLATSVRFLVQMGRQFIHDRCPRQAASLGFQTLLAFVPLAAVLLALTRWMEQLGDRPAMERLLERFLMPAAAADLARRIAELVARIDFETMGWLGLAGLVLFGGLLILQVEDVLNDVWKVSRARALWERALSLLGFTLLALPLLATAVYLSIERLRFPLDVVVPALLTVLALTVIYKLLPHIRVRWRSALAGALVATLLLGAGHELYGEFVELFGWTYRTVYGAIAFVPITLLWLYLAWLFFLLGAEVSYTGQHLDVLWMRARRAREMALAREDVVGAVSWPNAVRMAREVAEASEAGRGAVDPERLALHMGIHVDAVRLIGSCLVGAGVLQRGPEGGFRLTRPAAGITVLDVYDAVVDGRALGGEIGAVAARHREALRGLTLADGAEPDEDAG